MGKILISIIFTSFFFHYSYASEITDVYKTLKNSTIRINIWKNYDNSYRETISGGSGVVINRIDNTYFILTNSHVILEKFCLLEYSEYCSDREWDDSKTIVVDSPSTEFEYITDYDNIIWWENYDIAVIRLDMNEYGSNEIFNPIKIGGNGHPLMNIYAAGFPLVLGNLDKDYLDMFYCSGVLNNIITDSAGLAQIANYSLVHNCGIAGGMSGGPLVDENAMLLGINGLKGVSLVEETGEVFTDFDLYDFAVDIWDVYRLEIASSDDEWGHFDTNSPFYGYLPKLSKNYHSNFYNDFVNLYPNKLKEIKELFE